MKQAVQQLRLAPEVGRMFAGQLEQLLPLPPARWYVRGPRGGLYEATGDRTRMVGLAADDYIWNVVTVEDRSEGVRYLRPGTADHLRAFLEVGRPA